MLVYNDLYGGHVSYFPLFTMGFVINPTQTYRVTKVNLIRPTCRHPSDFMVLRFASPCVLEVT